MQPIVLCILDGVGIRDEITGNAFKQANKPNFDYLWNSYPHTTLHASGHFVGIPDGQMGNSEVGHMNIGAGRVVHQGLMRINNAISDGSFFEKQELLEAINNCKTNNTNLHLCGLVSDGGVHSHINHLFALLELCKKENFNRVYIHALLDGRDTEPLVAPKFINALKDKITELEIGEIITIGGRYYFMNRDRDWELTHLGYNAIVDGMSDHVVNNTNEAFEFEYSEKVTDEFMKPTVIKCVPINNGDSLILFNFRSDRMIQPLRALTDPNFKEFVRNRGLLGIKLVTLTEYEEPTYKNNISVVFKPIFLKNTLGDWLSQKGLKQFRITEAEKRGHITFYFSGCNDLVFNGEDRLIYDKDDVFTYDLKPDMRSKDITKSIIEAINSKKYALIVANFPNGDSVGHTGFLDKAIIAMEAIDKCLGQIIKETNLEEYTLMITADHGNCEVMVDLDGTPNKAHTTNKVPFILINKNYQLKETGKLGDIAPTILDIMEIDKPSEMTGETLIKR